MKLITVQNYEEWRNSALELLAAQIDPDSICWEENSGLFLGEAWAGGPKKEIKLPRSFVQDSRIVACHRDPSTWTLLYRLLWRLDHGEKNLFIDQLDKDVLDFHGRYKSVTRDLHKMKAFVRFKKTLIDDQEWFVAHHNPDHKIMRLAGPFFQERFKGMKWTIFTPDESAHWDGEDLSYSPGVEITETLNDQQEDLWKTYYASVFNPARIKVKAMKKEMPVRYWKSMPETVLVHELLEDAPKRLEEFYQTQLPALQKWESLDAMANSLQTCRQCGICAKATAPVMGEGPASARLMLIGEQPGDEEDKANKPFIGPAGKVLNKALMEAGLKRKEIYVTNAVKGFKWLPKEHRRWHRGADSSEIAACRPWLKNEIDLVKPDILVCLGRSAAQSVLGKMIKLEDVRGKFFSTSYCSNTIILPHPSSILRCQNEEEKHLAYQRFVSELQLVQSKLA